MTGDAAVVLARLERDSRLLAVKDFAGRFWGRGLDAVDVAGATGTPDFPRVIILSIKAEERTKKQNVADRARFCDKNNESSQQGAGNGKSPNKPSRYARSQSG